MSFGIRLKMLRVKYKLDQETMSRRLLISQPVYSRYENDAKLVEEYDPIVARVAAEFNISPQWLLSSDDEELLPHTGIPAGQQKIKKPGDHPLQDELAEIMRKQFELNEQILRLLMQQ